MEIERKYLLDRLPDLAYTDSIHILQGYICPNPVIRIRAKERRSTGIRQYILTVKGTGMVEREEFELELTEEQFHALESRCQGYLIEKERYLYPLDDRHTAEIDVFEREQKGLVLAEVEFETEADMLAFRKPDWFGEDVSMDPRYHNSHMAMG